MRYPRLLFFYPFSTLAISAVLSGCGATMTMSTGTSAPGTGAAPTVIAVGVQTNGVAPNRWQYVQFDEAMSSSTISNQTFVVTDSAGRPVSGRVIYYEDFRVAGFEPNPALQDDANYVATITTGVTSVEGVHLGAPYTYSFITRDSTDLSPLYVAHVSPAPDAICVSATTPITITFSEGADISTVNATDIVITGPGGTVIPARIGYDVATAIATLTPIAPLPSGTITVTIRNVADAAGVPMTSVYGWNFQTACSQPGAGKDFTVLHSFSGLNGEGANPEGPVVMDRLGNLYGTTEGGGSFNNGMLFKIDQSGNLTALHNFAGGSDGAAPFATNLLLDASGNLYGSASGGSYNRGIVFKIDASGNETVLHAFTGSPDGWGPHSLIRDVAGNIYGTTSNGGSFGFGTIFKLDASGNETVLYSFKGGTDGANPFALVRDSAGSLYGTTPFGGTFNVGTVFKLDPSGSETILYTFKGGSDGSVSFYGSLVMDSLGNLYGTTLGGGVFNQGTIFKVDPSGHKTVLHSLTYNEGSSIVAGLIMDSAGNLYGNADAGGFTNGTPGVTGNSGTVFKLDTSGNLTVLHAFDYFNGGHPEADLFMDPAGYLYGTTRDGGIGGKGTVFKLTP
jgi:uncharacterized repeat protein (TIGR03803 family)